MKTPEVSTIEARHREVRRLATLSGSDQGLRHDGFSVILGGWKDYYLRALPGAPLACQLGAAGEGRFVFGDFRKGFPNALFPAL